MIMVHTLLNNESPEVIRYFRHLEYLTTLWEKDREKYQRTQRGTLPHGSRTFGTAQGHTTDPDRASEQRETTFLQIRRKDTL